MLTLTCPYCGVAAEETELAPGGEVHRKRFATGGVKSIPGSGWAVAELVAKGAPGPLAAEFGRNQFRAGRFFGEHLTAGVAH